jgi:hypothetical protein
MKVLQEVLRVTPKDPGSEEERMVRQIMKSKMGDAAATQSTAAANSEHPNRITSSVTDPGTDPDPEPPTDAVLQMSQSQLESILAAAVQRATAEHTQAVNNLNASHELEKQLQNQQNLASVLQRHNVSPGALQGGAGQQHVAIALSDLRGGVSGQDAARELQRIYDKCETYEVATEYGVYQQHDNAEFESFIRSNKEAAMKGLEIAAKKGGLLRGNNSAPVIKQAGTTSNDISPFLLHSLSTVMRLTTVQKYNWRQFVQTTNFLGKNRGDGVDVPRYAMLECSDDPTDYQFGRDEDISARRQPIAVGSEPIVLGLNGLGKAGLPGNVNAVVSVSKFFESTSLYDLLGIVNKVLYESYMRWETAAIRTEYGRTTQNWYNNGGEGVTATAGMLAGCGGQLTVEFIDFIGAQMDSMGIPEYANGKYALQVGGFDLLPLRKDLKKMMMSEDKLSIEELTAVLQPQTPNGDPSPITGYVGNVGRFMIFSSDTVYKGPNAMASPTIAGSPRDIYNAYAFGADCIGRATAMPFTMVYDSNTNFGMRSSIGWMSIETIQAIDVDPSLSPLAQPVKQQNRVLKLKLARKPI